MARGHTNDHQEGDLRREGLHSHRLGDALAELYIRMLQQSLRRLLAHKDVSQSLHTGSCFRLAREHSIGGVYSWC